MPASVRRFSDFLRDLQRIDRGAWRGEALLDPFLRHTAFEAGALYLRDAADAPLRLSAKSPQQCIAPDVLEGEAPEDVIALADYTLVPLRSGRDPLGVLRFIGTATDEELETIRAAAAFASAMIANQRLTHDMREGDFQLKYRLWELESLYDIGLSIAGTLNIDELADEVLFRMISLTNARRAALLLREADGFKVYRSFGDVALSEATLRRLEAEAQPVTLAEGSVVAVPIRGNNAIIGVLAVAEREMRDGGLGAFGVNEMRLLTQFANQVGIALENARLHKEALRKQAMERELELAATIQRDILPRSIPKVPGIEIATLSRPARQVGGDYHAFFEHEDGVTIVVADVAGKSIAAALLVSALHAAIQLLFAEGRALNDIATELNKHIHRWSAENKFVTLIIVKINRTAQTLEFVNAGHNTCYAVTGDRLESLRSNGLPVGIFGHSSYTTQSCAFPSGSVVVMYSDGITEAENEAGEEFDTSRLEVLLTESAGASASALRDRIAAAVDAFVDNAPQKDDQTLVIARA